MKKIFLLLTFIIFNLSFSQRKVDSPFKVQDYFKMKNEFLDYAKNHRDEVLEINNYYYSTKKLDSILLVKDNAKKYYLINFEHKKPEEVSENDIKNIKDEYLLQYAVFKLKKNNFQYTLEYDNLRIENKIFIINVDNISNDNKYDISDCIYSKVNKITTCNTYFHKNYSLKSTRNNKGGQEFGISKEFDENGKLTKQIDWDKDFLITYGKAKILIHNYLKKYILEKEKDYFQDNNPDIENYLKEVEKTGGIRKTQLENGNLVWYAEYRDYVISIDAKTGKLVNCNRIYTIP